jgi:hypothetical protein
MKSEIVQGSEANSIEMHMTTQEFNILYWEQLGYMEDKDTDYLFEIVSEMILKTNKIDLTNAKYASAVKSLAN